MKKFFILSLVLCGALWADVSISYININQTSYGKIKLDKNYAYAVIQKPQGRGVTR